MSTPPRAAGGAGAPLRTVVANPLVTPSGARNNVGGSKRGEAAAEGTPVRGGGAAAAAGTPVRGGRAAAAPEGPRKKTARWRALEPGEGVKYDEGAIKFTKQGCVEVAGVGFVECIDLYNINSNGRAQGLLQAIPFVTETQFLDGTAPPGVYTYLVITSATGRQLVAKQPRTVMELGTSHQAIARDERIGATSVLFGGELWKHEDGRVEFNLLSGDYTWPRLVALKGDEDDNHALRASEDMAEAVIGLLGPLAPVYKPTGVSDARYQPKSFIRSENLPPPDRTLLDLYHRVGIYIAVFPTLEACFNYRREDRTIEFAEGKPLSETYRDASVEARPAILERFTALVARHGGHEYVPAGAAAAAAPPAAPPAPERKTRKQKQRRQRKQRSLKRSARKSRRN